MPKKRKPSPRAGKPSSLSDISRKLQQVLQTQEKILANQEKLLKEEKKMEQEEEKIETLSLAERSEERKLEEVAQKELNEIEQLQQMEKRIQSEVSAHPLKKITYRDFTKGVIGAFVGIVAHFSFLEGLHFAESFTMLRATLMYVTSLIIGIAFLYFSGFRHVGDKLVLKFIPLRIIVIYLTAIFVVVIVLWLFGAITTAAHFEEVYKMVSAISILAILGACTADLIGKEH